MSNNLDLKDKVKIETDYKEGASPGKLHLDAEDSKDVMDMFSRLSPGDDVSFRAKATLDDAGEKVITLSIREIEFDEPETEDEPTTAATGDEGGDSAAVTMLKNEDGVPEGDDNEPPPDSMPHAV